MTASSIWSARRAESFRADAITDDGQIIPLLSVAGGSMDWNVFRQVRGGGQITVVAPPDINWLTAKIRVSYDYLAGDVSGSQVLGTFLVSSIDWDTGTEGATAAMTLLDLTTMLVEDATPKTVNYPAGTVVTDAVVEQIAAVTNEPTALTHSEAVLNSGMVWPPGTPRIKIINELLGAINYFSLWADENGLFRAEPYVLPHKRPVAWVFAENEASVISADTATELDLYEVYNRIICIASSHESTLVGVATDEDPDSPYSYQARGRWRSNVENGVDATDQATINAIAERKLAEARQVVHRKKIQHLYVPLRLYENVRLDDGSVMALVEQTIQLQPGALVNSTLRRVERI